MNKIEWAKILLAFSLSRLVLAIGIAWFIIGEIRPTLAAESKWQAEWDRTVRAAEQEGQVSVSIGGYGALIEFGAFQKAYPKIKVNYITGAGTDLTQRIIAERRAGKYLLDVYNGGGISLHQILYLGKMLEPIKPALILPGVSRTRASGGKANINTPTKKASMFSSTRAMSRPAQARPTTRSFSIRASTRRYWDLFNPKLKGKILSTDIRRVRGAGIPWQFLYYILSSDRSICAACSARWT